MIERCSSICGPHDHGSIAYFDLLSIPGSDQLTLKLMSIGFILERKNNKFTHPLTS
jgi:hypothetical protein